MKNDGPNGVEQEAVSLELKDAIEFAIAEARMVLPGVQAIFGFQLIAAFNQRFETALSPAQQAVHLVALLLTAVAMALVMTPAAYHRRVQRRSISARFLDIASRMIGRAMTLLAFGLALDIYVVTVLVTGSSPVAVSAALAVLGVFVALWVIYPGTARRAQRNKNSR